MDAIEKEEFNQFNALWENQGKDIYDPPLATKVKNVELRL